MSPVWLILFIRKGKLKFDIIRTVKAQKEESLWKITGFTLLPSAKPCLHVLFMLPGLIFTVWARGYPDHKIVLHVAVQL